jgi:outer membrane protein assembly factor BamA
MTIRKFLSRGLFRVFLLTILLPSPQALAQIEAEVDEISEIRLSFERMQSESLLDSTSGGLGLEGIQFSDNPITEKAKKWPEDLVIAPVPGYSPQIGWNLKLAGGYFLSSRDPDSKSPASVLGVVAMISDNGSSAYGAGTYLHLLEDKLRVQLGAAYADVRYTYYVNDVLGSGNDVGIDLEQKGPLYFVKTTYRVWRRLYIGLGYLAGTVDTKVRRPPEFLPELPPELIPNVKFKLGALIIPFEIDSRDNDQFPRNGWKIDGSAKLYRDEIGSDFDAGVYKVFFNRYFPMRETDTLATRLVIKSSDGDAPFFLLSTFGGSKDLRGYPSGRYRDYKMYALQTEYRWHFNQRWIFTGFAGFGEVAETFKDFGGEILPAAGVGARFVLSKKHRISLSSDVGVGKDGVEFYFGIGEAF